MSKISFILLGESGVGKTTLLKRFKTGQFEEKEETTVDMEFHVNKLQVEGREVNLFLWDAPGQDRFNTLVSSYYRQGDGVLLLYDVTDLATFSKLSKWLNDLREKNERAEVLIVGNKNDDPNRKAVTATTVKNFARDENLEYMEISAKTGENVDTVFNLLAKKVLIAKGTLPRENNSGGTSKNKNTEDDKKGKEIILLRQAPSVSTATTVSAPAKKGCC